MESKFLRYEKEPGGRKIEIHQCNNCDHEIKRRPGREHSGLCQSCSLKKKPYEAIYNTIKLSHRNILVELSYEEFVELTKIKECHYCSSPIPWRPYQKIKGKFKSKAYFLDRKDNQDIYRKDNVVVCCTKCNMSRCNRYSYEEWFGMAEFLRKKKLEAEGKVFEEKEDLCVGGVCGI